MRSNVARPNFARYVSTRASTAGSSSLLALDSSSEDIPREARSLFTLSTMNSNALPAFSRMKSFLTASVIMSAVISGRYGASSQKATSMAGVSVSPRVPSKSNSTATLPQAARTSGGTGPPIAAAETDWRITAEVGSILNSAISSSDNIPFTASPSREDTKLPNASLTSSAKFCSPSVSIDEVREKSASGSNEEVIMSTESVSASPMGVKKSSLISCPNSMAVNIVSSNASWIFSPMPDGSILQPFSSTSAASRWAISSSANFSLRLVKL
mmetsp:Transcript_35167/g.48784  ORF Transcript_35167/g.48784 Transcript_35167/m.48784 type:complete len:270 (+) Transcript_35167:763-1572(+)